MIIHHQEDFSTYKLCLCKSLKYSDTFTFIPIKIYKNKYSECIIQTPLLFTPFGIQKTQNNKDIIDLSFQNKENDDSLKNFLKILKIIYQSIFKKYKSKYTVNPFIKETNYNECIRLKISNNTILYDELKNKIYTIDKFTYGNFLIHLEGIWINENNIWFQWNLLQAKIKLPFYLKEYSFIEEIQERKTRKNKNDKYEKMIKIGVPKEAVQRQKILDGKIPPPPPLPGGNIFTKKFDTISKIKAIDLQSVVLKKGKPIHKKIKQGNNNFEPPSVEELQTTLSKLKSICNETL